MNDNFLNSSNAPYVAELYSKYCKDPNSVDENWNNFSQEKKDEYCKVFYKHVLPIPKGMNFIEAAAIPENFFTVWTNLSTICRGVLLSGFPIPKSIISLPFSLSLAFNSLISAKT